MAATGKTSFKTDTDVHITFEDQQKINTFARLNACMEDVKEQLKKQESSLRNVEDATEELILMDEETDKIPFAVAEIFAVYSVPDTQVLLEEEKSKLEKSIVGLQKECSELQSKMSDLKTQLYAKFGSNINLENDDD